MAGSLMAKGFRGATFPSGGSVVLVLALIFPSSLAAQGPCDILGAAGNPCVAAHSTVRALYSAYSGALYNVSRPDGQWAKIGVLDAGGFADISAHEKFCAAGDCVIANIFDQSPQGNHLGERLGHKLANASQLKISVRGGAVQAYGAFFDTGHGMHVDDTKGIAKGNDPESIYAVMSGREGSSNGGCCFDVRR